MKSIIISDSEAMLALLGLAYLAITENLESKLSPKSREIVERLGALHVAPIKELPILDSLIGKLGRFGASIDKSGLAQ